jgi:cation-transporting ATPase 13A3/4/5
MTQPFFVFQYLVSLIYTLENVAVFAILMIGFGFVTTTVNYFLLKRSYNKIKETAEKLFRVKVLRNGAYEEIDNVDIVPGDLYEPREEVPCDSIVVKGELFVDEVNLTGENVPIAKFKLIDDGKHSEKSHWLFEGSKVETMKEHTLALAVNVGYTSQRGRIIRKILNKSSKQP